MKLIIDIPDDIYDDIQHNKGEYINTLNWAVRNGKPYDESGDCISRSALKKAFDAHDVGFLYHVVMSKIDNAPAVKFSLLPADESKDEAYMRGYEKGRIEGIMKANTKPKGGAE